MTEVCKGCAASVQVSRDQVNRLLAAMNGKGFDFVGGAEYDRRLGECRACAALAYGTTCMHCGCLVEVRAKLREKDCPHPGGSRWSAAVPALRSSSGL
jgi:hypothetical protein